MIGQKPQRLVPGGGESDFVVGAVLALHESIFGCVHLTLDPRGLRVAVRLDEAIDTFAWHLPAFASKLHQDRAQRLQLPVLFAINPSGVMAHAGTKALELRSRAPFKACD